MLEKSCIKKVGSPREAISFKTWIIFTCFIDLKDICAKIRKWLPAEYIINNETKEASLNDIGQEKETEEDLPVICGLDVSECANFSHKIGHRLHGIEVEPRTSGYREPLLLEIADRRPFLAHLLHVAI